MNLTDRCFWPPRVGGLGDRSRFSPAEECWEEAHSEPPQPPTSSQTPTQTLFCFLLSPFTPFSVFLPSLHPSHLANLNGFSFPSSAAVARFPFSSSISPRQFPFWSVPADAICAQSQQHPWRWSFIKVWTQVWYFSSPVFPSCLKPFFPVCERFPIFQTYWATLNFFSRLIKWFI